MPVPVLCVCRFLQLELSEMEAFVNQHKSKVIKRQVYPFSSYCPIKVLTFFKLYVFIYSQVHVCAWCGGQRMTSGVIFRNDTHLL